ncbi:MAG: DUF3380 domain-containing protein [Rhodothermales bacterium]|nr:DUF3380 domain-containing protein [Rhodothermales bacterium]
MPEPLTAHDYAAAAAALGCSVATIKAFAEVESGPLGGFLPSGEPTILYEPHVFYRCGGHAFTDKTVAAGGKMWRLAYPKWVRPDAKRGINPYGPSSIQHTKLAAAAALNRDAALQACSWGRFQILGENWRVAGYGSLQAFVNDMYEGERGQLRAFVGFCKGKGLGPILARQEWSRAVTIFNGPGQVAAYVKRLKAAHARYAGEGSR